MNFRISGQKIKVMKETKYLGMVMDEHLTLAKLRYYIMLIQLYSEQYTMPFLNPTCDMDVNYGEKHKHKS